jgi:hypothetical protein
MDVFWIRPLAPAGLYQCGIEAHDHPRGDM